MTWRHRPMIRSGPRSSASLHALVTATFVVPLRVGDRRAAVRRCAA